MQLLILLFIAGIIGYFLARSQYGKKIDETTLKITSLSEGLIDQTRDWWRRRFGKKQRNITFLDWATGSGAVYFPDDLRIWWQSFSPDEESNLPDLNSYADSLDFHLEELVSGGLDTKPALMKVFVESVVVYSHEYRRARQAQAKAEKAEGDQPVDITEGESSPLDKNPVAEKQVSRRKGALGESTQASTTG
jgi:hypothetical protein